MRQLLPCVVLFAIGCGGDSPAGVDAPSNDGPGQNDGPTADTPTGTFALTSTALSEGGTFPTDNTCDGTNVSPQLDWTDAPAGTMSFAVVLTDKSLSPPLIHSEIYDIPSTMNGLPADVDKVFAPPDVPGAHQTRTFGNGFGYSGPCPPTNSAAHNYEFAVHALDVGTLPSTDMNTTRDAAAATIEQHTILTAVLNGEYMR